MLSKLIISLYILILHINSYKSIPKNLVPSQVKYDERGIKLFLDIKTKKIEPNSFTKYNPEQLKNSKLAIEIAFDQIESISFYFLKFESFTFPNDCESLKAEELIKLIKGSFRVFRFNVNTTEFRKLVLSYADIDESKGNEFKDVARAIENRAMELFNDFVSYEMDSIYKSKKIIDALLNLPPTLETIELNENMLKHTKIDVSDRKDDKDKIVEKKVEIHMPFYEVEKDKQQIGLEINVTRYLKHNRYKTKVEVYNFVKQNNDTEYKKTDIMRVDRQQMSTRFQDLVQEIYSKFTDGQITEVIGIVLSYSELVFVCYEDESYNKRIYPRFHMLYTKKPIWEKAWFTIPIILGVYMLLTTTFIIFKV